MDKKKFLGDSVVTGWGTIDSRLVYVFSQDFTVFGGSLSGVHAEKICKIMDMAIRNGARSASTIPGGARIQEGVVSLAGYADVFLRNTLAGRRSPDQRHHGALCGRGGLFPALTDFIFMVKNSSHMFITRPDVVKAVTGQDVTFEGTGWGDDHNAISGVAHMATESEEDCLFLIREMMSYLPSTIWRTPVRGGSDDNLRSEEALNDIVPDNPNKPYDIRGWSDYRRRRPFLDSGTLCPEYCRRLCSTGASVWVSLPTSQWCWRGPDIAASEKGGPLRALCDCFNIPLIVFEDVPGFLPASTRTLAASSGTGPSCSTLLRGDRAQVDGHHRKAYGGAYCVMNSKHIRSDFNVAWPSAESPSWGRKARSTSSTGANSPAPKRRGQTHRTGG